MKTIFVGLALLVLVAGIWFLGILPGVYEHLAPSTQIALYGLRLHVLPFPSETARSAIARGNGASAAALADDLSRARPRLMPSEAAYILAIMQHRGYSLHGSRAEEALEQFLRSGDATQADVIAGNFALNAIRKDVKLPPSLQPR